MKIEFWQERWQANQIGFHLSQVNPHLVHHWFNLNIESNSVVFVPLCGKSLDLIWLANQGHHVIGVECSQLAIDAFFEEQKLPHQKGEYKTFTVFNSYTLNLLQGDYFDIDEEMMGDVQAVYDRAALVALPEEMRKHYVQKLISVLKKDTVILLITLEYDQEKMSGPPFSVSEGEVQNLYAKDFEISKLHQSDILKNEDRFRQKGLDRLIETVYKLKKI